MGPPTALKDGMQTAHMSGFSRSSHKHLSLSILVMRNSRESKGKARAATPSSPPQAGPSIPPISEAPTVSLRSPNYRFLVESSSKSELYDVDGGHELKIAVTTFRTLFQGNKASTTTDKTTATNTQRIITETIATPADLIERMLAAAQKAAVQAAADAIRSATGAVGALIDHPAAANAHADTSRQTTPNINDVTMSGGAGSDIFAMLISRPTTPTPPMSIMDDAGAQRLRRSVDADTIFRTSMAEISARIAAPAAAGADATANDVDIDMRAPSTTPRALRTATNFASGRVNPGITFNALNRTGIGAAHNAPHLAVNVAVAGMPIGSNITGAPANFSTAGGAAGPSAAGGGISSNDPPPPYSGPTNFVPVAQPSRLRLASAHARHRGGRIAAAAASARASQAGSSRNPISVDD
ncbi:hypothetical protein HYPSUDRAFT_58202 [Hypholoma sublateritium FD-334 SS-4]|uniref:Uncharacterized protein n=1 Tax=Hypholoma sublateritium (strain FD-334 SS-4) TaxID=945553 RepID=A0A0D2LZZ6_HYPSF|nr:hypothetical protein HYPSUDRAFT_58202 [Hypholoma sublateritium FD-334 SS-4]